MKVSRMQRLSDVYKRQVQEALKIGLVNDQIHTIVISGGTGVGKSYVLQI